MPITNNLIKINNIALRPSPKFNLSYETFKSGEYVIGGIAKISINGEIYGASDIDLSTKINNLSNYSGTCQTLLIQCDGSTLINGTAFIRSISFNPTDQPFSVTYTIDVEVSDTSSITAIKPDINFTTLYGITIPNGVILKSYEESLSLSSDDSLGNTAFYVDNSYTKASLKLNGQISIQAYHHMCDTFNSPDLTNQLYSIINTRVTKLLALDNSLAAAYPSLSLYINGAYTAINDNKSITINKFDNKIDFKFDIYIITGDCNPKGIVDISISETVDQTTGLSTWSVKGSIKGLANRTTNAVDNDVLSNTKLNNARLIYNNLENKRSLADYENFSLLGCGSAASAPAGTCYQRVSSQITENFNGGSIDFDMSYGDIEVCQIGGSNIDVNIQTEYPTHKYIEHIIPGISNMIIGQDTALVQIGANLTPYRVTITVSGKLNSCDNTLLSSLIDCVNNRFDDIIQSNGYNNYLLIKESTTTGKYSYKRSQSYIQCI